MHQAADTLVFAGSGNRLAALLAGQVAAMPLELSDAVRSSVSPTAVREALPADRAHILVDLPQDGPMARASTA